MHLPATERIVYECLGRKLDKHFEHYCARTVMYTQHVTRGKNPQKVFTLVWDQNIIHGLCSGYRHRGYSTGMLLFH